MSAWRPALAMLLACAGGATLAQDATTETVRDLPPLGPMKPAAPPAAPVHEPPPAGLRRCVDADGVAVFTDRRCDLMEAVPVTPQAGVPAKPASLVRLRTCARSQDDLLMGVRGALESRDPNKLAEFYHWPGMGHAEGYRLMERLANFAERPLLDVQLVSSAEMRGPPSPFGRRGRDDIGAPGGAYADPRLEVTDPRFEDAEPAAAPRHRADLLRVDQMRGDEDYESQVTWFHLRSNAGCWWLQF